VICFNPHRAEICCIIALAALLASSTALFQLLVNASPEPRLNRATVAWQGLEPKASKNQDTASLRQAEFKDDSTGTNLNEPSKSLL
jgi:hypothetical protein